MKHLKVGEARARFGELLDEAEKGAPVFIERRGVWFRLLAEAGEPRASSSDALFEAVDPAVMNGQWTWASEPSGLLFKPRRKRKAR